MMFEDFIAGRMPVFYWRKLYDAGQREDKIFSSRSLSHCRNRHAGPAGSDLAL